ncbi:MAG: FAD-dependent oxidoreductase, partial [Gammaproteobacteria bacterium]
AGVAQAAVAAGYDTLLLEQYAEAARGTSSRSSKLIHGGLRYLEGAHFGLVYESLRERAILLRNAPDLVRLTPMHIPVYGNSRRSAGWIAAGLSLYALLGGLRSENRFTRLAQDTWTELDELRLDDLQSVFRYHEAQTDDAALTRAVLASAQSLGAEVRYGAEVISATLESNGGQAEVRYTEDTKSVRFRVIVNATGPWAPDILKRITPTQPIPAVDLVRGTHIVLPAPVTGAYYLESPRDGRAVFVLPWKQHTLVGTTEALYRDDPATVSAPQEDIDYLLETYAHYFPGRPASHGDISETFAGLRVLPKGPTLSARSRETRFQLDRPRSPRLLTVLGGKLTTYRATAERVMRQIRSSLPPTSSPADTRAIQLAEPETDDQYGP